MMQLAAIEMRSPPKKCEDIPRDVEGEKKGKNFQAEWAVGGVRHFVSVAQATDLRAAAE